MNSTSYVSETSSSSSRHQHTNVKEEVDGDSMEQMIKVEGEGEEVPMECEDIEVVIKVEDEEKPIVCQCEECGSGCRRRMARCTREMAGCSSQAIKKEEWDDEDEQSGVTRRDKEAKRTEILVKEEVKKEEDEINMVGPSTQRCGSASADSVILKFEDDEDVTCPCEDCNTIKTEEGGEKVKEEEEVEVDGGESSDDETVIEDEEDWLPSTESSLGSSSEEEETEDATTELVQEPIEAGPSTAPLEVRPIAGADAEQEGPSTSRDQSDLHRQSSRSSHAKARTAKVRKRRRCPQCQKMVTHLTNHLRTHTGERPHICDQCRRAFALKGQLKVHLKTHTGEKAFSCDQCGKCFSMKYSLLVHLERHTGRKTHQCDQCSCAFVTKGELTSHRRQKHSNERSYVCHIANCDKAYASQSRLTNHLKFHNGVKKHRCEDCEMRFVKSTDLTRHRRQKHSNERPYTCPIANCDKVFSEQFTLSTHLERHTGKKTHQCDQCSSAFVTNYELTLHCRRKHTGERPYRCHFANCHKAFTDQSHLSIHLRCHNGEKRYQCEDCEMSFVTSSHLTRHRRRKHSTDRPHRCPHSGCNYAAPTKDDLKKHLNRKKHRQ